MDIMYHQYYILGNTYGKSSSNSRTIRSKLGLKINIEKPKMMKLLDNGEDTDTEALTFDNPINFDT